MRSANSSPPPPDHPQSDPPSSTTPTPFSEPIQGIFVTIDGPSGIGKSTTIKHLERMLRADAVNVHVTSEPSTGLIGQLARAATETLTGQALACLYTADRFHHLDTEILPHLSTGHTVICDRYVPSTLVMQRFDGVDLHYLWAINRPAPRPTLAVILEAKPATIEARLAERGPHNRFQRLPSSAHMETDFYADATRILAESGYELLTIECTTQTPQQIAATINDRLTALTRRTNHQA